MVVFTARGVFRKHQMDGNDYLDGVFQWLSGNNTTATIMFSIQIHISELECHVAMVSPRCLYTKVGFQ
jgi:hypothetical protein